MRHVGWTISSEGGGFVEPPNCGCIVPESQDAGVFLAGVGCATLAFEPHVDDHSQKLEEDVYPAVSAYDASDGYFDPPSFPRCEAVTANPERTCVGPADRVGRRMVTRFIDTPLLALMRKATQSFRSATTSSCKAIMVFFRVSGLARVRSIRSRKCRVNEIA